MQLSEREKYLYPLTIVFALGFLAGWLAFGACDAGKYPYLNKRTICNGNEIINKAGYEPFRGELIAFIDSQKRVGVVDEVSVYFRDLQAGPVFGISELDSYAPASLLKVPLALAYLSAEEEGSGILEKKISYTEQIASKEQIYKPSISLEAGKIYSIEELISQMLLRSDNVATELLRTQLGNIAVGKENLLHRTYIELGIITPQDSLDETISVRGYATIFRILYNVSYLNQELANKMLSWLSQSEFRDGLVGGVPKSVKVAHKFGERMLVSEDNRFIAGGKQLHDCGIIYYPDNPYILCVMTKGNDFKKLEFIVKAISKMVYEEVDSRRY